VILVRLIARCDNTECGRVFDFEASTASIRQSDPLPQGWRRLRGKQGIVEGTFCAACGAHRIGEGWTDLVTPAQVRAAGGA